VVDDRGYVEPNPHLYGRLASLAGMMREGLKSRQLLDERDETSLQRLEQLGRLLEGDIREGILVFNMRGGSLKPIWQSSNLDRPNHEISLEDIDRDGLVELVALEGDYDGSAVRQTTVWRWNGWGFSMAAIK
jgi:hypothetical protein